MQNSPGEILPEWVVHELPRSGACHLPSEELRQPLLGDEALTQAHALQHARENEVFRVTI